MTELNEVNEGDTIFWISSDDLNNPNEIKCDLVFKIDRIVQWECINPDRAEEMNKELNQFKTDLSSTQLAYENHFK